MILVLFSLLSILVLDFFPHIFSSFLASAQDFILQHGFSGLAILSFTEGFLNPLPISPLFGFAITVAHMPIVSTFFLVFLTNVAGGATGFFLGKFFGHPVSVRIFGEKRVVKAEQFFQKWGEFGVFLAAFTPIPFKVAAWSAGIFEMPFLRFLFWSLIGRFLHFLVVAAAFLLGLEILKKFL